MARSTMRCWVQRCPGCGYAARSLDDPAGDVVDLLRSREYQALSNDETVPQLARDFLCQSMIEEAYGWRREAFTSKLRAAWVADDASLPDLARACRLAAAARVSREPLEVEERLQLVDVLRRGRRWTEALQKADTLLSEGRAASLAKIAQLQKDLITRRDAECHSLSEVDGTGSIY